MFSVKNLMYNSLSLLLLTSLTWADRWQYFYPEAVTNYGCKVSPVVVESGRDANEPHEMYTAEAWAVRGANLGRWEMSLDYFPKTPKGRRQALKACAAFMDEADRRVSEAAPIRVKK